MQVLSTGAGSIGSASAPEDGTSPDALLSKADIALYAAKADGRRVWRAFEQEMDAKIQIPRLIELELRAAVATDQIEVYFQPIVSVATRRIVGFEALARWRSALLGAVPPSEFIPIVEEIGLMEEMGAAVLRRACKACAGWPDGVSVSVNLSSTQFRSGNLEKTIIGALTAASLQRPSALTWRSRNRRCSRIGATRAARSTPCAPKAYAFRSTISAPDTRA